jgi:hypothetical protein
VISNASEEWTATMEAGDVQREQRSVEPAHELDHLTFGTTDVEAGQ